jgi:hypothetical protein
MQTRAGANRRGLAAANKEHWPMYEYIAVWQPPEMKLVTILTDRIDLLITWLFVKQPPSRVFAVNMALVGISNIMDNTGNVNRALLQWGVPLAVIHLYMALIPLASVVLVSRPRPPIWWYLPGISYIALIIPSLITLFLIAPSTQTLSTLFRVDSLNALLLYFIIRMFWSRND